MNKKYGGSSGEELIFLIPIYERNSSMNKYVNFVAGGFMILLEQNWWRGDEFVTELIFMAGDPDGDFRCLCEDDCKQLKMSDDRNWKY